MHVGRFRAAVWTDAAGGPSRRPHRHREPRIRVGSPTFSARTAHCPRSRRSGQGRTSRAGARRHGIHRVVRPDHRIPAKLSCCRRTSSGTRNHRVSRAEATFGCSNHRPPSICTPPRCARVRSVLNSDAFRSLTEPPPPRRAHPLNRVSEVVLVRLQIRCAVGVGKADIGEDVTAAAQDSDVV